MKVEINEPQARVLKSKQDAVSCMKEAIASFENAEYAKEKMECALDESEKEDFLAFKLQYEVKFRTCLSDLANYWESLKKTA